MKTYTIKDGKLTSLDTYFYDGKWRLLQAASNSGLSLWSGQGETAATFEIVRPDSSVPYAQFPSFAVETTPFSISNSTVGSLYLGYFITEEAGHPYLQIAMATWVSGERVVKKYDLVTGAEVTFEHRFSRVNCLYSILTVNTYGIFRIVNLTSGSHQMTLYLVAVRSGTEGAYLYDYKLITIFSGTATTEYYYVPADIVYTIGASDSSDPEAIQIATRAEMKADAASSTAHAAMNAVNMANLDDKISV